MSESLRVLPPYNRARVFASRAHHGQVRKYTGEPYVNHLIEVGNMVSRFRGYVPVMAAAFLHDIVEDTNTTHDQILDLFGREIAELVYWLTDQSLYHPGNRATRKKIDREFIAHAPADAQTIKLADLISNTRSIVRHDPDFAKVYLAEKVLLLEVLTEGNATLHAEATRMVHSRLALTEVLNR